MKLLFINQYYWPDSAATAQMLTDLCEHLAQTGHDVHVLASRGQYDTGSRAGKTTLASETHHDVRIHRVRAAALGKRSVAAQAVDFASFHLLVGLRTLLAGHRYDAVITLTTPPLIGVYATAVRAMSKAKHVCWVMDLHPDVEFALGVLSPRKLLPSTLAKLNDGHLRQADACVALGEDMRERLLSKSVKDGRIRVIRLWGHDEQGGPAPPSETNPLRQQLGLAGKFIVGYSGNAGLIHTFDEICQATLELRGDERFEFLFIGGGRRLQEVKAFVAKHDLTHVRLLPYFPREQLPHSLALPDVHLISLRPGLEGVSVPSKLYGIMAASRPAVFIGPPGSETARTIRAVDCGRAIASGDAPALTAALRELAGDAMLRDRLGRNARAAFESTYNAKARCEEWRVFLEGLTRS